MATAGVSPESLRLLQSYAIDVKDYAKAAARYKTVKYELQLAATTAATAASAPSLETPAVNTLLGSSVTANTGAAPAVVVVQATGPLAHSSTTTTTINNNTITTELATSPPAPNAATTANTPARRSHSAASKNDSESRGSRTANTNNNNNNNGGTTATCALEEAGAGAAETKLRDLDAAWQSYVLSVQKYFVRMAHFLILDLVPDDAMGTAEKQNNTNAAEEKDNNSSNNNAAAAKLCLSAANSSATTALREEADAAAAVAAAATAQVMANALPSAGAAVTTTTNNINNNSNGLALPLAQQQQQPLVLSRSSSSSRPGASAPVLPHIASMSALTDSSEKASLAPAAQRNGGDATAAGLPLRAAPHAQQAPLPAAQPRFNAAVILPVMSSEALKSIAAAPLPLTAMERAERMNDLCALCEKWYLRNEAVFELPVPERLARLVLLTIASPSRLLRLLSLRLVYLCAGNLTFLRAVMQDTDTVRWLGLCGDRELYGEVEGLLTIMERMLALLELDPLSFPGLPFGWLYRLRALLDPSDLMPSVPAKRRAQAFAVTLHLLKVSPEPATAAQLHVTLLKMCLAKGGATAEENAAVIRVLLELFDDPITCQYVSIHDISVLFAPFLDVMSGPVTAEQLAGLNNAKELIAALMSTWVGNQWLLSETTCLRTIVDILYLPGDVDRKMVIITLFNRLLVRLAPHRGIELMETWLGVEEDRRRRAAAALVVNASASSTAVVANTTTSAAAGGSAAMDASLVPFAVRNISNISYRPTPTAAAGAGGAVGLGGTGGSAVFDPLSYSTLDASRHGQTSRDVAAVMAIGRARNPNVSEDDEDDDDESNPDADAQQDFIPTTKALGYHVMDPLLGQVLVTLNHMGLPLALIAMLQTTGKHRAMLEYASNLLQDMLVLMDTVLPWTTVSHLHDTFNRFVGQLASESNFFVDSLMSQLFHRYKENKSNSTSTSVARLSLGPAQPASLNDQALSMQAQGQAPVSPQPPQQQQQSGKGGGSPGDDFASLSNAQLTATYGAAATALDMDDATFLRLWQESRVGEVGTAVNPLQWNYDQLLVLVQGPLRSVHRLRSSTKQLKLLVAFYTPRNQRTMFFLRPFSSLQESDVTPAMCSLGIELLELLLTSREGTALLRDADYPRAVSAMLREVRTGSPTILTPSRVHSHVGQTLVRMAGRLSAFANGLMLMREFSLFDVIDSLFIKLYGQRLRSPRGEDTLHDVCCQLLVALHLGSVPNYGVSADIRQTFQAALLNPARTVRMCAVLHIKKAVRTDLATSMEWGIGVLLDALRDEYYPIVQHAFKMLLSVCLCSEEGLEYFIGRGPAVLMESAVIAEHKKELQLDVLLYLIAGRSSGFRFLHSYHWIEKELRRWEQGEASRYVRLVRWLQCGELDYVALSDASGAARSSVPWIGIDYARQLRPSRSYSGSVRHRSGEQLGRTMNNSGNNNCAGNGSLIRPGHRGWLSASLRQQQQQTRQGVYVPLLATSDVSSAAFFPAHFAAALCRTVEGCALFKRSELWTRSIRCILEQPLPPDYALEVDLSCPDPVMMSNGSNPCCEGNGNESDAEEETGMDTLIAQARQGIGAATNGADYAMQLSLMQQQQQQQQQQQAFLCTSSAAAARMGYYKPGLYSARSATAAAAMLSGGPYSLTHGGAMMAAMMNNRAANMMAGTSYHGNRLGADIMMMQGSAAPMMEAMYGGMQPYNNASKDTHAISPARMPRTGLEASSLPHTSHHTAQTEAGSSSNNINNNNNNNTTIAGMSNSHRYNSMQLQQGAAPAALGVVVVSGQEPNYEKAGSSLVNTLAASRGPGAALRVRRGLGVVASAATGVAAGASNNSSTTTSGSPATPISAARVYKPWRAAFSLDCVGDVNALKEALLCIGEAGSSDVGYAMVRASPQLLKHITALARYASTISVRAVAQLCFSLLARSAQAATELAGKGYAVLHSANAYVSADGVPYAVAMVHLRATQSAALARKSAPFNTVPRYAYGDYPLATTTDVPRRIWESLYALSSPVRRENAKAILYKIAKKNPQAFLLPQVLRLCLDCGSLYCMRHAERKFIADLITTAQKSSPRAAGMSAANASSAMAGNSIAGTMTSQSSAFAS